MSDFADYGGWPELLTHLLNRNHLTAEQAHVAMMEILSGEATPAQLVGFIVALRAKGESAEELSGLLDAALEHATSVPLTDEQRASAIDVVGTGGDRSHSINVSTMAALVAAGAGATVCKHGARSASSKAGTADVLEVLGVNIDPGPEVVAASVKDAGFGFCFAPAYHPAFRFAAPSRREIGIPTVFNLLGPMANPGRVKRQVIGVADAGFAERMVDTLRHHGSTHAWVVHGGGLDELSTTGSSSVVELRDGEIRHFEVSPRELGLGEVALHEIVGGDAEQNGRIVRAVLGGEEGPHRDIVVLNAAAALVVAGVAADLADGLDRARVAIDDGKATEVLDQVIDITNTNPGGAL